MSSLDVLSDALRVIRLKGTLFLNGEFGDPWCVNAPSADDIARAFGRGPAKVAICHLVVEGRCWVKLPGAEAIVLEAGDVAVLPHGDAHVLGSSKGSLGRPRDTVAPRLFNLAHVRYGGAGARSHVICGWFGYERDVTSPAMAALPPLFGTSIRQRPSGAWLEGSIRYAAAEAASGRAGASAVADKLAEVLFVESLRSYLESRPAHDVGWLAALRNPLVGRAVALIHERPGHGWTVATLARAGGASRTVLAERFTALMGVSPMAYVAQWRIAVAAHLLREGRLGVSAIAAEVGYESEAAFSRSFKRVFGASPGTWRKRAT